MNKPLDDNSLNQLFLEAHTYNKFTDKPVSDEMIRALYDLLKWGPTAMNCQPARYVFVKTPEGKERLIKCLSEGNVPKVKSAPVTVIVATDTKFYDNLPTQWTAYDGRKAFTDDLEAAKKDGFRNGTLSGAYMILAARAVGLDAGPMSGFDNEKADREFFPDGRFKSNFLINLGYGAEGGHYPRGPRLTFEDTSKIV